MTETDLHHLYRYNDQTGPHLLFPLLLKEATPAFGSFQIDRDLLDQELADPIRRAKLYLEYFYEPSISSSSQQIAKSLLRSIFDESATVIDWATKINKAQEGIESFENREIAGTEMDLVIGETKTQKIRLSGKLRNVRKDSGELSLTQDEWELLALEGTGDW